MKLDIKNEKFYPITVKRNGSSRSPSVVKAKIVHTSHNKRRMEVFIPKTIWEPLNWKQKCFVEARISTSGVLRLTQSFIGSRANFATSHTSTFKICISGDFIKKAICSPVRPVEHQVTGESIFVQIPAEWLNEVVLKEAA